MAQVILGGAGRAIGGPLGSAIGSAIGAQIDRLAIGSLQPERQVGPRLGGLQVQGAAEGAPIPAAFGRVRVVGQVVWAARFLEHRREQSAGKGGPRSVDHGYSLSFAVGLCEGPIDGIGRVWADGEPVDLSGVAMRVHRGREDQAPDTLIEAVEGEAPAYRGLAYVVFEDLPLDAFGDRAPQLAFEVFRRPRGGEPRLEDKMEGVCLIPGSGEFVYATAPVLRRESLIRTAAENVNNRDGRADVLVSLDQLQAQLPNLKRVTVVVSWFGSDLRAGECQVRPGVERAAKDTAPETWRVNGVERGAAHVVSQSSGGPAYGGTPSDASVLALIAELKARGLEATLLPFLLMDVPAGNGLPDLYGGAEQGAYPWRGRISCHPAPGEVGSPDGTAEAAAQVAAFFGTAAAGDFEVGGGAVSYAGPDEWSWRRMVLHYAHLAALAGADGLVIGSELRGLTRVRGEGGYPAVEALRGLARDCRAVLGEGPLLTYAADWSEWSGLQHADDPGGFVFNLDPLWADEAISCVGVDWYPPLTDWRDGQDHLDALAGWSGPADAAYLAERVQGGEGWDWFYTDEAARVAQARAPIEDPTWDEPWVFRPKNVAAWWSHAHHDRVGGVRAETPTGWTPGMKPVRLVEFGCGAVDRGGNAPNLFLDPKSSESAAPPFSDGTRDDLVQRRALEAVIDGLGASPAVEAMDAWCWDARPFPDFPGRTEVWADGANWETGHWLNGRMLGEGADLAAALCARAGVTAEDLDLGEIGGAVDGFFMDRPMTTAQALAPLLLALGAELTERGGRITAVSSVGAVLDLAEDDLALPDAAPLVERSRVLEPAPGCARARFIDGGTDYRTGSVVARREGGETDAVLQLDLPLVATEAAAEAVAARALALADGRRETATVALSPLAALRLEPGDLLRLPGEADARRVERIDLDETPTAALGPVPPPLEAGAGSGPRPGEPHRPIGAAWMAVLDLPGGDSPLVALAAEPWVPMEIHAGPMADALTVRARADQPGTVGVLAEPLGPGRAHRWDEGRGLLVRLEGRSPESAVRLAVLGGANLLAVESTAGGWEVLQFRTSELTEPGVWRLSGLLRGQGGTEGEARAGAAAGSRVVVLDGAVVPAAMTEAERGLPLIWRAGPAGSPPGGSVSSEETFIWRGVARRPWSPAHLRAIAGTDGAVELHWTRRTRQGGDGWDLEPPLGEEREVYRVELLAGASVVATYEATTPAFAWTAEAQAEAFPDGVPSGVTARVAQGSATWGWGAAAELALS
ncbi:glycoside hydrolase/phage tail family protein [Brevundimonas sp.]|uniref:baseplate multidomain protein megatron n=1 Tax=Brevundimonas sp. TaxID=1871086 RepID=UPI0025E05F78|nr:glycoside hydrolase/phage tail family protein [Brevundimonas sp.]